MTGPRAVNELGGPVIPGSIRPGFSIIDVYFDKYRRQNDFKTQYCHSTILHCGPHLAWYHRSCMSCADHVM